jgi:L-ascorbate metabolism protein UlaG (beta-lactamase superfamily)
MRIHFYGHSTFHITGEDGTTILIDPYATSNFLRYEPRFDPADIVLVTHEHGDHNNVDAVPGHHQIVRGAGTHTASGITFTGIPSFHDRQQGAQRGPNTILLFDLDGMRIAHFGDQGVEPEEEQYAALAGINVMFMPVGGGPTLEVENVIRLIDRLKPNVVIPAHFKTEKVDLPLAPVETILAGQPHVRRADGADAEITKETLPAPTEYLVIHASR